MKLIRVFFVATLILAGLPGLAQTCQNRDEIPDQTRAAIETAAQRVFDQAATGDVNGLKANAVPSLQSNFNGIATAVNDNKPSLSGARPQMRTSYLLDTGAQPSPDGAFYCGVFGANGLTPNSTEFDIPNLTAGKYAIAVMDVVGSKGPFSVTPIFQDLSGWKLAGFYVRPESATGHDGLWYLQRARDFKTKGQPHNAWFYYVTSWDLLSPVTFMDTQLLSKIKRESGDIQPKDVPSGTPVSFNANGKSYSITDMSIFKTEKDFDLAIKYSVPSAADFNATLADAQNLGKAFVGQYPELKDGFGNVWVHAVDANGADVTGLIKLK